MYTYFRGIAYCFILMTAFTLEVYAQKNNIAPIDLGLSVKWANMNVGANSPEEYGDYFSWGEVKPKRYYGEYSIYKHFDEDKCYHKYNFINFKGSVVDGLFQLESVDDAATEYYGNKWRMPTENEMQELLDSCSFRFAKEGGTAGFWVKRDYMRRYQSIIDSLKVYANTVRYNGSADSLIYGIIENYKNNLDSLRSNSDSLSYKHVEDTLRVYTKYIRYKHVVDSLREYTDSLAIKLKLDSMFLPLAGYRDFGNMRYYPATKSGYWTSSLIHKTNRQDTLKNNLESVKNARCLFINKDEPAVILYEKRTKGFVIRAVYNN